MASSCQSVIKGNAHVTLRSGPPLLANLPGASAPLCSTCPVTRTARGLLVHAGGTTTAANTTSSSGGSTSLPGVDPSVWHHDQAGTSAPSKCSSGIAPFGASEPRGTDLHHIEAHAPGDEADRSTTTATITAGTSHKQGAPAESSPSQPPPAPAAVMSLPRAKGKSSSPSGGSRLILRPRGRRPKPPQQDATATGDAAPAGPDADAGASVPAPDAVVPGARTNAAHAATAAAVASTPVVTAPASAEPPEGAAVPDARDAFEAGGVVGDDAAAGEASPAAGLGADADGRSAARERIRALRSSLMGAVRDQARSPRPESVNLILTPVAGKAASARPPAAEAEAPRLRGEPLTRQTKRVRPVKPGPPGEQAPPAAGRAAAGGDPGASEAEAKGKEKEKAAPRVLQPKTRVGLRQRVSVSGSVEAAEAPPGDVGSRGQDRGGDERAPRLQQGRPQRQQPGRLEQQQPRGQMPPPQQQHRQWQPQQQRQGRPGQQQPEQALLLQQQQQQEEQQEEEEDAPVTAAKAGVETGGGGRALQATALRRAEEEAARAKAAAQREAAADGQVDVRRDAAAERQRQVQRANELFAQRMAELAERLGVARPGGRSGAGAAAASAPAPADRGGGAAAAAVAGQGRGADKGWDRSSGASAAAAARAPSASERQREQQQRQEQQERWPAMRPAPQPRQEPPLSLARRLIMQKKQRVRRELERQEQGLLGDQPPPPPQQQQGKEQKGRLQQPQQRQQQQEDVRRQQQQQQQQERERQQADMLRGLAQMFRNFARQTQPAVAAAALIAAVSPATAAAAAAAGGGPAGPAAGPQPGPFGFLGRRANDVNLILKPVASKEDLPPAAAATADSDSADGGGDVQLAAAAAAAADGSQLRARPLPTRAEMLRLMKPVPKARLPYIVRRSVEPSDLTPVSLPLSVESVARAGLEVGGPAYLPSVQRARRRRMYYYRVLKGGLARAKPLRQGQGQEWAPEHAQGQGQASEKVQELKHASGEGQGGAPGQGQVSGEDGTEAAPAAVVTAAAAATSQPPQRRYALYGRSYKVQARSQYSDRLKRIVRKAGGRSRGIGTGGGAAASAAAAAAGGTAVLARGGGGAKPAVPAAATAAADDGEEEEDIADEAQSAEDSEEDARGEYNPAAEVVNDVYEQVMGVRLPERAMYGKRAEALAALTPEAVRTQCRAWIEACGREYAPAFHAREPFLLSQPPQTLLLSLEHLSKVFGLNPDECVRLALRSPALIGLPYEQLQGAVEAVSEALEIGVQEASKIVSRYPVLAVRQPLSPVAGRVELVGALLPVSRDKLRQVLRQRPALLCRSAQHLATFMMSVSSVLNVPLFDVSLMIAGCPGVAGVGVARLGSRWAALQQATSGHPAWREQLTTISPPSLARCLAARDAAIERLQIVLDRGLASEPEFASFKRLLTMSSARFGSLLLSARPREGSEGRGSSGDSSVAYGSAPAERANAPGAAAASGAASAAAAPAATVTTTAIIGSRIPTGIGHSGGSAAAAVATVPQDAPQLARAGV